MLPLSASASQLEGGYDGFATADATYTIAGYFYFYPGETAYVSFNSGSNSCFFGSHNSAGTLIHSTGRMYAGQTRYLAANSSMTDVDGLYVNMQCDSTLYVNATVYK